MKKKIVALCLCIALAVVAIGGATLAYFTDTEDVTNTFTVGNVDIKLDEPEWTEGSKLVPGTEISKDPTVTVVKGSEECYVRILMTISNSSQWDAIFNADKTLTIENFFKGYDPADWTYIKNTENANGNTRTYEFRYKEAVNALNANADVKLPALFTDIVVPSTLTGTQIATLSNFKIVIEAQAIQTASFNNDVDAAWAAFTK